MSAADELAELNELIASGERALDALRARRTELIDGRLPGDEDAVRELAGLLHARDCRLSHEDQCAWEYEEDWLRSGAMPTGEPGANVWHSDYRSHKSWRESAVELIRATGRPPREAVAEERKRAR